MSNMTMIIINKKHNRLLSFQEVPLKFWCWGHTGRYNRVVLPACAVAKIREASPSADGRYKDSAIQTSKDCAM